MKKKIVALSLCVAMLAIAIVGGTLAYFTDVDTVENAFTMGKVDIVLDEAEVDEFGKAIVDGDRVQENDYTATNMVPGYKFDKDPTIHVMKGSENAYIFLDVTLNKYKSLFWVMAADAAADEKINLPLYDDNGALADAFKNGEVFSATAFITYMLGNKETFQAIMDKWFIGIEHKDWEVCNLLTDGDGTYLTLRLAYQGDDVMAKNTDSDDNYVNTVEAKNIAEDSIDIKFMDGFQMPASVTQEMIAAGTGVGGMQNNFNTDEAEFQLTFKAYAIQAAELADVDAAYAAMFN